MPARQIVTSTRAPAPYATYSQAVRFGDLLFCSGQLPSDPETHLLATGDLGVLTRRCLANLHAVCEQAGARLSDAVHTRIYLTDLANLDAVNEAYGAFFDDRPPARTSIQVAGLPLGSPLEIDAVVALPSSTTMTTTGGWPDDRDLGR